MGVVGIGVWRGTWAALAEGRAGRRRGRSPSRSRRASSSARSSRSNGRSASKGTARCSRRAWAAARRGSLLLALASYSSWPGSAPRREPGSALSPAPTGRRAPRCGGLLLASGVLAVFVAVFTLRAGQPLADRHRHGASSYAPVSRTRRGSGRSGSGTSCSTCGRSRATSSRSIVLALAALWLFPLAAWLGGRTLVGDAAWAFLDPGGRLRIPLLGRVPLEPWRIGIARGRSHASSPSSCSALGLRCGVRSEDTRRPPRVRHCVHVLGVPDRDRSAGRGGRRGSCAGARASAGRRACGGVHRRGDRGGWASRLCRSSEAASTRSRPLRPVRAGTSTRRVSGSTSDWSPQRARSWRSPAGSSCSVCRRSSPAAPARASAGGAPPPARARAGADRLSLRA